MTTATPTRITSIRQEAMGRMAHDHSFQWHMIENNGIAVAIPFTQFDEGGKIVGGLEWHNAYNWRELYAVLGY